MNKCGDCKFWGKSGETDEYRECQGVVFDKNYYLSNDTIEEIRQDINLGIKDNPYLDKDKEKLNKLLAFRKANLAGTQDGSGYKAALVCKEHFGCVLFQEK